MIHVYAKYWLADDGCFYLTGEERFCDIYTELDPKDLGEFAASEARKLINAFNISPNGGLKALEKALRYRLYTSINRQKIEWIENKEIILRMFECRLQKTRHHKKLKDFPCKDMGLVGFTAFAKTVDL